MKPIIYSIQQQIVCNVLLTSVKITTFISHTSILAALLPLLLAPFAQFPPQIDTLDMYDAILAMALYTRDQTDVRYFQWECK